MLIPNSCFIPPSVFLFCNRNFVSYVCLRASVLDSKEVKLVSPKGNQP